MSKNLAESFASAQMNYNCVWKLVVSQNALSVLPKFKINIYFKYHV